MVTDCVEAHVHLDDRRCVAIACNAVNLIAVVGNWMITAFDPVAL
jgi:hypothetical protein